MVQKNAFKFGIDALTPGIAIKMALGKIKGVLSEQAVRRIKKGCDHVQVMAQSDKAIYGVNTGFGPLCTTRISAQDTQQLQSNILKSHSCGIGEMVEPIIAKLMLILKAHALSFGFSGVSEKTVRRIIWHVENDIIPAVPSQGSVGASGDLAPLAHLFLPLLGLGYLYKGNELYPAHVLLKEKGIEQIELGPKEGLALINGTQFMAAHAVWGLYRMGRALDLVDLAGAMTLDALLGSVRPFYEDLHRLRPHAGQVLVAHRLSALLNGSELIESHRTCSKVQDPYSLRCMPQIHGASRNAWLHLKDIMNIEINSVTDNPIILEDGESVSGGHFHGQPIALPIDYATLAASELGNVSDRRLYLLLHGDGGVLPKFLIKNSGLHSGFMILQYTTAALASENKTLCMPASADSIPTSLGQEDHVSMGSIAARKFNRVLDNLEKIVSIELLCASQAIDFRRPLRSSDLLDSVHGFIRNYVTHAEVDRVFSDDILSIYKLVTSGQLTEHLDSETKRLNIDLDGQSADLFSL